MLASSRVCDSRANVYKTIHEKLDSPRGRARDVAQPYIHFQGFTGGGMGVFLWVVFYDFFVCFFWFLFLFFFFVSFVFVACLCFTRV